ncbi:hypothetical protein SATMO3_06320 [Sporomusa aerivorans]
MLRNNRLYVGVFLFAITILCSACGAMVHSKASQTVQPDSGTQNQNYQGVAQPAVPKTLKLSEVERKNGIQKFPILSSTGQPLTPEVQVTHTLPTERPVDVNVKPHL